MDKNQIVKILREEGVNPSYQRINIYEYLNENRIHPTVDEIYRDLVPSLPTLSKTTVYNTLDLFVEKGIAKALKISEGENRYELTIGDHSHFYCVMCDAIEDMPLKETGFLPEGFEDYEVIDSQVLVQGICPTCKTESK